MGRKALVPYALYRGYGFVNPSFGTQTSFADEDLTLFWQALQQMWDLDHSAGRGLVACRALYVFSHEHPLGDASAHTLFERVRIERLDPEKPPRGFQDYQVLVDDAALPEGVTLSRLVG
jgi:CRISPR-associated protein Csd2